MTKPLQWLEVLVHDALDGGMGLSFAAECASRVRDRIDRGFSAESEALEALREYARGDAGARPAGGLE